MQLVFMRKNALSFTCQSYFVPEKSKSSWMELSKEQFCLFKIHNVNLNKSCLLHIFPFTVFDQYHVCGVLLNVSGYVQAADP